MRLTVHLARLLRDVARYSVATRRLALLVLVVAGFVVILLALAAQTTAPLAIYPFA
ncbi:hypothetical protein PO878_15410 [Iamia majanohamensis]|uniref:Uncharacterized protein n=1 Tax=Iamia majanohamensis TaxID=467976 RepID=A0AAF0BUL3_9ACTN|nr:hypothetical protein [Iamia majanohamensis]WCO65890.1 hypothetical protein PO878_15410 [Iamia majanohamensis]